MKISPNFQMSILLGVSHFITDAIASFTLTSLSLASLIGNGKFILSSIFVKEITFYFFLYNAFAFFAQFFVAYFYDKIDTEKKFFQTSKSTLFLSFYLYFVGLIVFSFIPLIGVLLVAFGSCFFHISAGNIAIISEKYQASHLGIFSSGGVVGLAVGSFLAFYLYEGIIFLGCGVLVVIFLLLKHKKYFFGKQKNVNIYQCNLNNFFIGSAFFFGGLLILRSSIWTYIQMTYPIDIKLVFIMAIFAGFGKILGGILWDRVRCNKIFFFMFLWGIGAILFILYFIFFKISLFLLLIVFFIQTSIVPLTMMLISMLPNMKSQIIGYTFGLSLVFGYWVIVLFV